MFDDDDDYTAFERVLTETLEIQSMRVCAYCVMPDHWHIVLWPEADGDLARFMQRLTNMHVQQRQQHKHLAGTGHVYQGRYKSFPVETDESFYQVSAMWKGMHCEPTWSNMGKTGVAPIWAVASKELGRRKRILGKNEGRFRPFWRNTILVVPFVVCGICFDFP